jgi:hypothetical protein
MHPIVRNILAVVVGFVVGSAVNMGLIEVGPSVIPLPEGADFSTAERFAESMKLLKPVNFITPFLAHAM